MRSICRFAFCLPFLISIGCSRVWVIQRGPAGGVIGYKNFSSGAEAHEAIDALIDCPNGYSVIVDQLRGDVANVAMPVYNSSTVSYNGVAGGPGGAYAYNGSAQVGSWGTRNTPVQRQWRELTYSCNADAPVEQTRRHDRRHKSKTSEAESVPGCSGSQVDKCMAEAERHWRVSDGDRLADYVALFQSQCDHGNAEACGDLCEVYSGRPYLPRNKSVFFDSCNVACKSGDEQGCYRAAVILDAGGQEEEARRMLDTSCQASVQEACDYLSGRATAAEKP